MCYFCRVFVVTSRDFMNLRVYVYSTKKILPEMMCTATISHSVSRSAISAVTRIFDETSTWSCILWHQHYHTVTYIYTHSISTATKSNTVKYKHYGTGINVYCSAKWDDNARLSSKKSLLMYNVRTHSTDHGAIIIAPWYRRRIRSYWRTDVAY